MHIQYREVGSSQIQKLTLRPEDYLTEMCPLGNGLKCWAGFIQVGPVQVCDIERNDVQYFSSIDGVGGGVLSDGLIVYEIIGIENESYG